MDLTTSQTPVIAFKVYKNASAASEVFMLVKMPTCFSFHTDRICKNASAEARNVYQSRHAEHTKSMTEYRIARKNKNKKRLRVTLKPQTSG